MNIHDLVESPEKHCTMLLLESNMYDVRRWKPKNMDSIAGFLKIQKSVFI